MIMIAEDSLAERDAAHLKSLQQVRQTEELYHDDDDDDRDDDDDGGCHVDDDDGGGHDGVIDEKDN